MSKQPEMKARKTYTYTANLDVEALVRSLQTTVSVLNISDRGLSDRVIELCRRFASQFKRIAESYTSAAMAERFYDSCKQRYADLTELGNLVQTDVCQADQVVVFLDTKNGPGLIGKRWDTRTVIATLVDHEETNVFTIHRQPKCYKYLMLAQRLLIEYAFEMRALMDIDLDDVNHTVEQLSLLIVSVGKIYESMRPNDSLIEELEEAAFQRLTQHVDVDHNNPWYPIFLKVLSDIRSGSNEPYVRDIVQSIRRTNIHRPFSYEDFHLSLKSSGSMFKGRSIPALYASAFETDPFKGHPIDKIIGYSSEYNDHLAPGCKQSGASTITIEQHKLDRRVIHMRDNPVQDRLNYIHRILQEILDRLRTDCTRNQFRGVQFAMKVTDPAYRLRNGNTVISLDISKATDTLPLEIQVECLRAILGDELADFWEEAALLKRTFRFHNGKKIEYIQDTGQPQGYKSSFPAFALVHHILMRMVMYKLLGTRARPENFYRVLGDDSIISTYARDPKDLTLGYYMDACAFINWSTNESKGYVAREGDPFAYAEFAKKRVLNGRITTPIPCRLLLNAGLDMRSEFTLCEWISENYQRLNIVDVMQTLRHGSGIWSDEDIHLIDKAVGTGLIPGLSSFSSTIPEEQISDRDRYLFLLAYFVPKLEQTLIDQFIPDHLRDVGAKPYKLPSFMLSNKKANWDEICLDLIEDGHDNKIMQVMQMNFNIIEAIQEVLHGESADAAPGVIALRLKADEEDILYSALELVQADRIPVDLRKSIQIMDEACRILYRYNPRGDSKSSYAQAFFVGPIIDRFRRYDESLAV